MPKRAIAVVEVQDMTTSALASEEEMAKKILADHIRDRMAKPATAIEQRLWQELKEKVEKERVTFRS